MGWGDDDHNKHDSGEGGISIFSGWNPSLVAALFCCVPFIAVDFFNYFSAGAALAFSAPVLAILYGLCGWGAAWLEYKSPAHRINSVASGAIAGIFLWLLSTVINIILGLVLGTLTLGPVALLGVPYLCCCAPAQLLAGVAISAFGGFIGSLAFHRESQE